LGLIAPIIYPFGIEAGNDGESRILNKGKNTTPVRLIPIFRKKESSTSASLKDAATIKASTSSMEVDKEGASQIQGQIEGQSDSTMMVTDEKKSDSKKQESSQSSSNVVGVYVENANPREWSGLSLTDDVGIYECTTTPSGGASYATSNMAGKNCTANLRLTTGPDIFVCNILFFIAFFCIHCSHRIHYVLYLCNGSRRVVQDIPRQEWRMVKSAGVANLIINSKLPFHSTNHFFWWLRKSGSDG
jgi:hypothetical protein